MSSTTVGQLASYLESVAPPALQASYDNSGLLVGEPSTEIRGVLCSLDCTEDVVAEAIKKNCNVVVAHHPIVFSGLKRLTGSTYVERTVLAAIRGGVALYACHTNLDSVLAQGVNGRIAEQLQLKNVRLLSPTKNALQKLAIYVPPDAVEAVSEACWSAGGGQIGRYDRASFRAHGIGTFRPLPGAHPSIGQAPEQGEAAGRDEHTSEVKLQVVVPRVLAKAVLQAARSAHPYEEMAYDLYDTGGTHPDFGSGALGTLASPLDPSEWLQYLSEQMGLSYVRHTQLSPKPVETVAVCGGAGGFLLEDAKRAGADVFVTADYKYHEYFDADGDLTICDIGHYESERFTIELLYELIAKRFGTFAAHKTQLNTNPVRLFLPSAK